MKPSDKIDEQIANAPDWRGQLLKQLRQLIHEADPEIQEAWKWNTAVFVHGKNICAIAAFKDHVKINFFDGAKLPDPHGLFNAGLDAAATRAIDFHEGDSVNEPALQELIRAAAG
jgi:hypothetical protein